MEAELLHTYSRIDPYDTLILCVRVAVLTAVTLTVPIVLFPVSAILLTHRLFSKRGEVETQLKIDSLLCWHPDQVRRAIQQMMFPNKTFYWPRHIAIAFVLLTFINLLVIFAPNILGIFGVIGRKDQPRAPTFRQILTKGQILCRINKHSEVSISINYACLYVSYEHNM